MRTLNMQKLLQANLDSSHTLTLLPLLLLGSSPCCSLPPLLHLLLPPPPSSSLLLLASRITVADTGNSRHRQFWEGVALTWSNHHYATRATYSSVAQEEEG